MSRTVMSGVDINLSEEQKDMGKKAMTLKVGENAVSTVNAYGHEPKKSK